MIYVLGYVVIILIFLFTQGVALVRSIMSCEEVRMEHVVYMILVFGSLVGAYRLGGM